MSDWEKIREHRYFGPAVMGGLMLLVVLVALAAS